MSGGGLIERDYHEDDLKLGLELSWHMKHHLRSKKHKAHIKIQIININKKERRQFQDYDS